MKKFKVISIVLAVLMLCGWASYYEHNYTRQAIVTEVDCIEVTAEDNSGHYWKFSGNGYQVGDKVILKMYDNNTPNYVKDDVIKDVR